MPKYLIRNRFFYLQITVLFSLGFTLSHCRSRSTSRTSDTSGYSAQDLAALSSLLNEKCASCHSSAVAEGEFGGVENLEILRTKSTVVTPGKGDESPLYIRVKDKEMPPTSPLSASEAAQIKRWIDAGAPGTVAAGESRSHVSISNIYEWILKDIASADRNSVGYIRYISLATYYNALGADNRPSFSDDMLTVYRNAISKIVNSLSWRPALYKPVIVDGTKGVLLRVDLSKLSIARNGGQREIGFTRNAWENLSNPHVNVFNIPLRGAVADAVRKTLGTEYPVMDAAVFARFVTEAPHYNSIIGIEQPGQNGEKSIERDLIGIDAESNIKNYRTSGIMRAGFTNSGVSQSNRLIERHETQLIAGGYYWKSYDFAKSSGTGQLLNHIVGPSSLRKMFFSVPFEHDGGEVIWSLPNGMQAYGLYTSQGTILGRGPREIVSDPVRGDVVNAVSCMFCHAGGMIKKQDEMRERVINSPGEFKSGDIDFIKVVHKPNDELQRALDNDANLHKAALAKILDSTKITAEPVNILTEQYRTNDIDIGLAAAHFYLSPTAFRQKLELSPARGEVSALLVGGKVRRDQFDLFAPKFIAGSNLHDPDAAQKVDVPFDASRTTDRGSVEDVRVFICASQIEGPGGYKRQMCATSNVSPDEANRLALAKCTKVLDSVSGNGYTCNLVPGSCKAVPLTSNPCFNNGYK